MQITLEIPDDFAAQISENGHDLPRRLLEDAAVGAYCRDTLSRHELQSRLGFATQYELDMFLKERGIEHGSYSGQDLLDDIATLNLARLKQKQTA
ncbi:UPF0175 family protein [Granulicella tundricola]|uniref:Uncharacterized protein n=1 Tax=Granulicella tundricola (strain ATCC BAA-1859 / DSM 23138 / MP5ACTX9) TaxID=1198114 RepID=E8X076_GRATM|nr:UPF0175 family protein [Granulicella tundricola]ADW70057.1 hypothetical protein AciX9_3037 [Granulicella tundricola MP5ACTX9]